MYESVGLELKLQFKYFFQLPPDTAEVEELMLLLLSCVIHMGSVNFKLLVSKFPFLNFRSWKLQFFGSIAHFAV